MSNEVEEARADGRRQAFAEVLAWAVTAKELFGKHVGPVTRETVSQVLGGLESIARDEAEVSGEDTSARELLAEEVHLHVVGRAGALRYGVLVRMRSVAAESFVQCIDADQASELAAALSAARRRA